MQLTHLHEINHNKTPFLTAPAGVQYFTGVRPGVTGVQLRSPGCTGVTMKPVGVHPSQPEMQNLAGVEISALKSDWGALQAHEKFHRGGHKLSTFTPVHPGLGSEVGCVSQTNRQNTKGLSPLLFIYLS